MNWKPEFKKSTRPEKKYMVTTPKGKLIHFGGIKPNRQPHSQFRDSTGLGLFSKYDHNNPKRRQLYRIRHRAIKTKDGTPAYKDKEQPAYYSWFYLW
jgi:hypothetical protein